MELTIERDAIKDAVTWAYSSSDQRGSLPVLAALHLEADTSGMVTVSGYDYDVCGQYAVPVESIPGKVLLPGRILQDVIKALPRGPVRIVHEPGGTMALLTCGTARFELPVLPVEDYPTLPGMPEETGRADAAEFASAVAQVLPAKGGEKSPVNLRGVHLKFGADTLTLTATDRYRIAQRRIPWEVTGTLETEELLVSGEFLAGFQRGAVPGEVLSLAVDVDDGRGVFGVQGDAKRGMSRVIPEAFPNVERVMKAFRPIATFQVDIAEMVEAVKRTSLILNQSEPLRLTFTSDEVTLSAANADGKSSDTLPIKLDGDPDAIEMLMNPIYLGEALSSLDTDVAFVACAGYAKQAIVSAQPVSDPTTDYWHMVQTVRAPANPPNSKA